MRAGDSQVNNLLHNLRGEQFRHSQNVRKDRTHLLSSHSTHSSPTLPVSLTWPPSPPANLETEINSQSSAAIPADTYTNNVANVVAGPIPRSWALKVNRSERNTLALHVDALCVVLSRLASRSNSNPIHVPSECSPPPSLTLLCLRILLSFSSGPEFAKDVVPFLPPHLRCDLLRYTAVHSPLSNSKLYALCEPEGHADGELIIVGPQATLRAGHFRRMAMTGSHCIYGVGHSKGDEDIEPASCAPMDTDTEEEWDASHDEWSSTPLQTFILASSYISTATLFTLPPTLTALALVNLPSPIPLHRLPSICPLLSFLDLSYNKWLVNTSNAGRIGNLLDRIDWSRWNKLRVLALRGCHPSVTIIESINQGRWTDVEIIQ